MTSITFDTMDAARSLRNAGMDERTAEAIVSVVRRTADLPNIDNLATKDDLRATNTRIDDLRTVLFASIGFNLAGFLAVGGFLYTVLKP